MVMPEPAAIRIEDWIAVRSTGELKRGEQTVHLEPRVMDVLFALAESPGRAVSLQQLMDAAWGDIAVAPESVYQAIAALRKALAKDSDKTEYIVTVPKRGYRLAAPATPVRLREDQEQPEPETYRGAVGAKSMRRALMLFPAALVLIITVFLARFPTFHSAVGALPGSIVVVASDGVDGAMADGLVRRFLQSAFIRLLTPSVPMYAGPNMDEQVLMARTLDADFVVSLSQTGENQIKLSILDLTSDEIREREHFSIDYSRPEIAATEATKRLETIIGASRVNGNNKRGRGGSTSQAAQLEALGRYFMQRRFVRDADPQLALDNAGDAFRQAIEADEDFVPAWTGLALSQALRSEYGPREDVAVYLTIGRAAIDKALAVAPNSAEAYGALGLAANIEGDYLAARAALERAVSLDPANPMLTRWLAVTMNRLGYYRKAAKLSAMAAEAAPFSLEILHSASIHSQSAGDLKASIKFAEEALDLHPEDIFTTNNLMVAYRRAGQLDKAIAAGRSLLRSLQLSGDAAGKFDYAIGMVSNLYLDLGLFESARVLAGQAETDFPDEPDTVRSLVRLDLAEGNIGSARRRITYWAKHSDEAWMTAGLAVYANIAGLDTLSLKLIESLPEVQGLPGGTNPMLEAGRWLRTDYLYFASLPAVYRARLHIQNGEIEEAQRLLGESERFLDYWSEQGLSRNDCLYLLAAVHAMKNETDAGLEALLAAVESGWRDAWRIRHDSALDGLRGHPEFADVLSRLDEILMSQRKNVIAREARRSLPAES